MRHQDSGESQTAGDTTPPSECPACRSSDVKTTSKVVNAESYWRCAACGEVWNVGRLKAASRHTDAWSYRR